MSSIAFVAPPGGRSSGRVRPGDQTSGSIMSGRIMKSQLPLLAVLVLAGCGPKPASSLHSVQGTVKWRGGEALGGGTVEFTPLESDDGSAVGEIGGDGSFTMFTLVEGKRFPGVKAGSYRVAVTPPSRGDRFIEPIELDRPVTIVDGPQSIPLEVPRPR